MIIAIVNILDGITDYLCQPKCASQPFTANDLFFKVDAKTIDGNLVQIVLDSANNSVCNCTGVFREMMNREVLKERSAEKCELTSRAKFDNYALNARLEFSIYTVLEEEKIKWINNAAKRLGKSAISSVECYDLLFIKVVHDRSQRRQRFIC